MSQLELYIKMAIIFTDSESGGTLLGMGNDSN